MHRNHRLASILPSITHAAVRRNKHLNFISVLPREGFIPLCIDPLAASLAHVWHAMLADVEVFLEAELGRPSEEERNVLEDVQLRRSNKFVSII